MIRIRNKQRKHFTLIASLLFLFIVLVSGLTPTKADHQVTRPSRHAYPLPTPDDRHANQSPAPTQCPAGVATAIGTAWPLNNGYVVTNYHVVANSSALALQNTDGEQFKAVPALVDPANDLALLSVESGCRLPPALPLCGIEAPTGTPVFTLGFPRVDRLGYAPKFAEGVISSGSTPLGDTNRYVTTVNIQPGNSGGPLLNAKGEVVGIVTAMLGLQNESTGDIKLLPNHSSAVKIDSLRRLMDQLPPKAPHMYVPIEPGIPIQALGKQLADSMLIVIVHGYNG